MPISFYKSCFDFCLYRFVHSSFNIIIIIKESKNGEGHNIIKTNNIKALDSKLFCFGQFMNLSVKIDDMDLPTECQSFYH